MNEMKLPLILTVIVIAVAGAVLSYCNDARIYMAAARAWRDPYSITGFVYAPWALLLAAPFALLPTGLALIAWNVAQMAAILAGEMMMRQLGETAVADVIEKSAIQVIGRMKSMAAGKMGFGTTEIGDMVAERVAKG